MDKRNITVCLDRITITGAIKLSPTELSHEMEKLGWTKISEEEYLLSRNLGNDDFENIAGLYKNPYQTSWRVDTSNRFISDEEKQSVQGVVGLMGEDVHLTRIDVAFDFKNGDKPNMAHRIYRYNYSDKVLGDIRTAMYSGRGKNVETIYNGARKSGFMIRYYDKLVEQRKHRERVDKRINQWERLEVQLRGDKADEWLESAKEMLDYFKMPNFMNLEPKTRAIVVALQDKVISWDDLSKNSKGKYRKIMKGSDGFDTEYADLALRVLEENTENIQQEIDDFFALLN